MNLILILAAKGPFTLTVRVNADSDDGSYTGYLENIATNTIAP